MATLPAGTLGQILVKGATLWEAKDVDNVTVEIDATVGLRVKPGSIGNSQITSITKAGSVSGSALTNLALIPPSAGNVSFDALSNLSGGAGFSSDVELWDDPFAPVLWEDLDMSGEVGPGSFLALIEIFVPPVISGGVNSDFAFRTPFRSIEYPTAATALGGGCAASTVDVESIGYVWVRGVGGLIQWYSSAVGRAILTLKAYILL